MKVGDWVKLDGSSFGGGRWKITAMLENNRARIESPNKAWLIAPLTLLSPLGHRPPGKASRTR